MRTRALLQTGAAEFVAGAACLDGTTFAIQGERCLIVAMGLAVLYLAVDGGAVQAEIMNAGQLDLILGSPTADAPVPRGRRGSATGLIQRLGQQRPVAEQTTGNVVDQRFL